MKYFSRKEIDKMTINQIRKQLTKNDKAYTRQQDMLHRVFVYKTVKAAKFKLGDIITNDFDIIIVTGVRYNDGLMYIGKLLTKKFKISKSAKYNRALWESDVKLVKAK